MDEMPCDNTCQNSNGPVRFYFAHAYSHGQDVEGRVYAGCPHHKLDPLPDSIWTITSNHPLTVTPSLHWTDCGCHGFIANGEWVPA